MRAGAYPPGARYDINPATANGNGDAKIPRHRFSQNAIRAWLVRVAKQCRRIFAAMRTRPLDVRRQGEGNMCRIGRWSLCRAQTTQVCGQGGSENSFGIACMVVLRFVLWRDHRQEKCKRQEGEAASGQWEDTRKPQHEACAEGLGVKVVTVERGQPSVTVFGDAPVDAGEDRVVQAAQDLVLEPNPVTRRSSGEV